MKSLPELKPTRFDALVAAAVLALALILGARLWFPGAGGEAPEAVVSVNGTELERVPLQNAERVYQSNGYTVRVEFSADGVWVAASDCPTQDCVHTGRITRAGQSIVCLPARLTIVLAGAAQEFDAVAG
ncbi:MAG: NusG domain II-containing protein [Oscillospiraceae bacterium]|nr:NusG domain II-containing protein [Oscillospiraceae bacterium]